MAFAALVILASLNRETGFILVGLHFAFYGLSRWRKLALLTLIYVAITTGLHLVLGSAPHMLGLTGTIEYNIENLGDGLMVNAVLVPLWIALAIGFRCSPPVLKRFVGVGGVYMLAIIVGASWAEILRLSLSVFIVILPSILRSEPSL